MPKKTLTPEMEAHVKQELIRCEAMGLVTHIKQMAESDEYLVPKKYIKVNLPEHDKADRNGEGIWAQVISDEDKAKYDADEAKGTIQVIALNDSLYWPPLRNGVELTVVLNGKHRPSLSFDWLRTVMEKAGANFEEVMQERYHD